MKECLRQLLEVMISGLSPHTKEVSVSVKEDDAGTHYSVSYDEQDTGFVLGKGGAHADAIRAYVRAVFSIRGAGRVYIDFTPNRSGLNQKSEPCTPHTDVPIGAAAGPFGL